MVGDAHEIIANAKERLKHSFRILSSLSTLEQEGGQGRAPKEKFFLIRFQAGRILRQLCSSLSLILSTPSGSDCPSSAFSLSFALAFFFLGPNTLSQFLENSGEGPLRTIGPLIVDSPQDLVVVVLKWRPR